MVSLLPRVSECCCRAEAETVEREFCVAAAEPRVKREWFRCCQEHRESVAAAESIERVLLLPSVERVSLLSRERSESIPAEPRA